MHGRALALSHRHAQVAISAAPGRRDVGAPRGHLRPLPASRCFPVGGEVGKIPAAIPAALVAGGACVCFRHVSGHVLYTPSRARPRKPAMTGATSATPRAGADVAASGSAAGALNEDFAVGDSVRVEEGKGGQPKVVLTHPSSGSSADVYLLGACVTSWRLPSGEDVLYVRPDAVFTGEKPISGGIPHCFPQFGPGKMQQHGFARNLTWQISATSADVHPDDGGPVASVELILEDNDYTRSMWDASFRLSYKVSLKANQLVTSLTVVNTGEKACDFTAALHTYFSAAAAEASVKGLNGCRFLDKDPDPVNPRPGVEEHEAVNFPGFVDRMYLDAPADLVLETGLGRAVGVQALQGWKDAVVWNPHLTMKDFYKDFVCVENAKLEKVVLSAGDTWHAEMQLTPM
ncbi:hypothetical protein CBR_g22002 [Chara braunii]|uniref:glucose-6-phosphate 1-epimerase n=1 Tax=Chara braunii TaxID=69332 RepID=A0A388L1Q8_CHABU|nr:hypothetical protein CBR_g22002 [Chara braunii]|eukprot:GBG76254.1 hypothetical protein CBR_g22002 [Chara braunii]